MYIYIYIYVYIYIYIYTHNIGPADAGLISAAAVRNWSSSRRSEAQTPSSSGAPRGGGAPPSGHSGVPRTWNLSGTYRRTKAKATAGACRASRASLRRSVCSIGASAPAASGSGSGAWHAGAMSTREPERRRPRARKARASLRRTSRPIRPLCPAGPEPRRLRSA